MSWVSPHRIRERIHNMPLEKEGEPRRFREVTLFLLVLLLLVAPALLNVAWQARFVRTRYAVEALRREEGVLDQQYLRLRVERAALESLEAVSQKASGDLGLLPPQAGTRIVIPAPAARGEAVVATLTSREAIVQEATAVEPETRR